MIKDSREEKSFREYLSDINNMHHTNRVSEEEETLERNMPNIEEYLRQNRLVSFENKGDFDLAIALGLLLLGLVFFTNFIIVRLQGRFFDEWK